MSRTPEGSTTHNLAWVPFLTWSPPPLRSYAYPSYFTDELVDEIANNPKARGAHGHCWPGAVCLALSVPACNNALKTPVPPCSLPLSPLQVCKYIDMPLQHISNLTLLAMNRPPQVGLVLRSGSGHLGPSVGAAGLIIAACGAIQGSQSASQPTPQFGCRALLLRRRTR